MFFFFFKQKTAYEMRISDWSSDVCSSDLVYVRTGWAAATAPPAHARCPGAAHSLQADPRRSARRRNSWLPDARSKSPTRPRWAASQSRSEEHTSELQSLMRISYAVFCLKKNTRDGRSACTTTAATR